MQVIDEPAWDGEEQRAGGQREIQRPTLVGQQGRGIRGGIPLLKLETEMDIPGLLERFRYYVKLNGANRGPVPDVEKISTYMAYYYNTVAVPVTQFQEDSEMVHKVRWTGKRGFRQRGIPSADWVWVRRRERAPPQSGQMGELDGRMIARQKGLCSVR